MLRQAACSPLGTLDLDMTPRTSSARSASDLKPLAQLALVWGPIAFAALTLVLATTLGGELVASLLGIDVNAPVLQSSGGQSKLLVLVAGIAVWLTAAFAIGHLVGRAFLKWQLGRPTDGNERYPSTWFKHDSRGDL